MRWQEHILLEFLKLGVPLYQMGLGIRKFQARQKIFRLPVPVISVGNLTVGGTGKSLMVSFLAQFLQRVPKYRPGIVCRGYKGKVTEPVRVSSADPQKYGDEAALLYQTFPSQVAVGKKRERAAQLLIERGANVILLDDGFQYWSLHRDVDILLWDALLPIPRRLLPSGPLREPLKNANRATLICLTRTNLIPPEECERKLDFLQWVTPEKRIYRFAIKVAKPPPDGLNRVLAVCGIANPISFTKILENLSLTFKVLIFPDHHPYSSLDVQRMIRVVQQEKLDGIITTRKDIVKLSRFSFPCPISPLEVTLCPEGSPEEFEKALLSQLSSATSSTS